jgi:hypothetical protein
MARKLRASEALIAWTPPDCEDSITCGMVGVGPLIKDGERDWTRPYVCTGGAAWGHVQHFETLLDIVTHLFGEFGKLTVHEGMDPKVVHRAFLSIKEYADTVKKYRAPYDRWA